MKKVISTFLLACLLWLVAPVAASATLCGTGAGTCFVTASGGTRLWSATATWSDTSGGAAGAFTPATGDMIFMDANSGASTADANRTIWGLDATGFTGTFIHNTGVTLTISGNDADAPNPATCTCSLKLVSGMTYSPGNSITSQFAFVHSGASKTSTWYGGKTGNVFGSVTINITDAGAVSKVVLGDGVVTLAAGATLTLTDGVFDHSNQNLSTGLFSSSNSNTRTWTMGSGTLTLTSVGSTPLNLTTSTNLTATCSSSTIDAVATATGARTFVFAPTATCSYGTFKVTNPSINAQLVLVQSNSPTIATVTLANLRNLVLSSLSSLTVSTTFTWTGPSSSTPGSLTTNTSAANLSVANAVSTAWIAVNNVTRTGAGSFTVNPGFDTGLPSSDGFTVTTPTNTGGASCVGC